MRQGGGGRGQDGTVVEAKLKWRDPSNWNPNPVERMNGKEDYIRPLNGSLVSLSPFRTVTRLRSGN